TMFAYDAVGVLVDAMKRLGVTDKTALAKAIRDIKYDGVLGQTTFDANGQTHVPIAISLYVVKDGKWAKM
ncbi:MAG: branched-chain amino acid ABC transporter substrate-binding protein, partial [Rhodoplanes sp.]